MNKQERTAYLANLITIMDWMTKHYEGTGPEKALRLAIIQEIDDMHTSLIFERQLKEEK